MIDPIDFSPITFLNLLPAGLAQHVREISEHKRYLKGQQIEQRGSVSTHISIIHSGLVRLGVDNVDGSRFNISVLGSGNSFGELSMFLKQPIRHDAHAETDLELYRLSACKINQLIEIEPKFSKALLKVAYARFDSMLNYVGDSIRQSIDVRTAKLIIDISKGSNKQNQIVCRQIDLGHALGVSRVTIGKALKGLQDQGLIEIGYGKITISSLVDLVRFVKPIS